MQDGTKRLTIRISERDLADLHHLARIGRSRAGILARQAVLLALDNPSFLLSNALAGSEQTTAFSEQRRASQQPEEE